MKQPEVPKGGIKEDPNTIYKPFFEEHKSFNDIKEGDHELSDSMNEEEKEYLA